ncbi:MAG: radical SAM protein [Thermodesulfobacteriota bacterium]|nr:radical SAM protein [Thermodesulfobacteriota bacterium]
MKILLIYPYCLENRIHAENVESMPIGIYYVAAVLKENNYDVEILNWQTLGRTPEEIREVLARRRPDVIGFSILQANRWGGIEISRVAKQINPDIKIVFGGITPTFLWKHFLTHFPEIDYVVRGEGEYTFLKLVQCIEKRDFKKIRNIRGIAYRKKKKPVKTRDVEPIKDLDELPNPAKYFTYEHLALTRGCPGNCTFCGSPKFWGQRVRFHSADYFVDQIELLYKRGITFFLFSDDTFTFKKQRVIEICIQIIKRGLNITWFAISRVNFITEEVVLWMRKAGCIQISFGVESGSPKIREALNKKISNDQIRNAFRITIQHGILARAYIIFGCPGETRETIQESIDLINKIKPLVIIFHVLVLFPGTALYAAFKNKFNMSDDVWLNRIEDIMYFETDQRLSRELMAEYKKRLSTNFYQNLPSFVDEIDLIDNRELYPGHADFYSRLAMTFDHGEYSGAEALGDRMKIAEKLYEKSLEYHPVPRAFLGLGMIRQKKRDFAGSIEVLLKGIKYFPDDEQINICMGISYMNLGRFDKALSSLLKFQGSIQAVNFIAACYSELNDSENEAAFRKKLHSMKRNQGR